MVDSHTPLMHCCVAVDTVHYLHQHERKGRGIFHCPLHFSTTTPPPAADCRTRAHLPPQAGVVQGVWRVLSTLLLHVRGGPISIPTCVPQARTGGRPFPQPVMQPQPTTPTAGALTAARVATIVRVKRCRTPCPPLQNDD